MTPELAIILLRRYCQGQNFRREDAFEIAQLLESMIGDNLNLIMMEDLEKRFKPIKK